MKADTPLPVLLVMVLMWLTAIVYVTMMVAVLRARKTDAIFNSSFYSLFLFHGLSELMLFIYVVIFYVPCIFNYFDLYTNDMKWQAEIFFFALIYLRTVVPLSQIGIAINRFTVFKFPIHHNKIWSSTNVNWIFLSVLGISFVIVFPFWWESRDEIHFDVRASTGRVHIMGARFTNYMMYTTVVATSMTVGSCVYFYGYAVYKSITAFSFQQKVEHRLLVCAMLSSIPFVVEMIRVCLIFFGMKYGAWNLVITASYAWLYQEAATFLVQVVVQLAYNTQLRKLFLRQFGYGYTVVHVVSLTP